MRYPPLLQSALMPLVSLRLLVHKAWVKFLARNRKKRNLTHIICDIDTYLLIEGRSGRPGTTAYDLRLAVIDPQATAANTAQIGFW